MHCDLNCIQIVVASNCTVTKIFTFIKFLKQRILTTYKIKVKYLLGTTKLIDVLIIYVMTYFVLQSLN